MPKIEVSPLVLLNGDSPYTTSEIIADGTGIARRKIRDAIRKYQGDLESFGRVASYRATLETSGGPQKVTVYHLNEQQAAFLLTLLKNTPVVVEFKKELVRQFYAMRDFIRERSGKFFLTSLLLHSILRL